MLYSVKNERSQYLQGVKANEKYSVNAVAPTMGARHGESEYNAIWSKEEKLFDRRTLVGYLAIVYDNFAWGNKKPQVIRIIPKME